MRQCAENGVVISYLFLSDPFNRKVHCIMTMLARPVTIWHSEMELAIRSVRLGSKWLTS